MGAEAVEQPTAAERELADYLAQLKAEIAGVPEGARTALLPLHDSLGALDQATSDQSSRGFVQALVGLARAVLEVREDAARRDKAESEPGYSRLAQLPLPPYDLWLPFKAGALRSSDEPSSRFSEQAPVRNKKIAGEVSSLRDLLASFLAGGDRPQGGQDENDPPPPR